MRSGHRWADIQEYTMGQFKAFCKSAIHFESVQQASLIAAVAQGAQGNGQSIKKAIDTTLKNGS